VVYQQGVVVAGLFVEITSLEQQACGTTSFQHQHLSQGMTQGRD